MTLSYCLYEIDNGSYVPGPPQDVNTVTVRTSRLMAEAVTEKIASNQVYINIKLNGLNVDTDGESQILLNEIDSDGNTARTTRIDVTDAAMTTAGQNITHGIADGISAIEINKIEGKYNGKDVNISLNYYQKL